MQSVLQESHVCIVGMPVFEGVGLLLTYCASRQQTSPVRHSIATPRASVKSAHPDRLGEEAQTLKRRQPE